MALTMLGNVIEFLQANIAAGTDPDSDSFATLQHNMSTKLSQKIDEFASIPMPDVSQCMAALETSPFTMELRSNIIQKLNSRVAFETAAMEATVAKKSRAANGYPKRQRHMFFHNYLLSSDWTCIMNADMPMLDVLGFVANKSVHVLDLPYPSESTIGSMVSTAMMAHNTSMQMHGSSRFDPTEGYYMIQQMKNKIKAYRSLKNFTIGPADYPANPEELLISFPALFSKAFPAGPGSQGKSNNTVNGQQTSTRKSTENV